MFTFPGWPPDLPTGPLLEFNPDDVGPEIQPMPADNTEMVALGLPATMAIFPGEDAAGAGVVTEAIAGANCTPAGNFITGQKAKGLQTAADWFSKLAFESEENSGTSQALAANASIFDFDAVTSFVWFLILRLFRPAANGSILSKRTGLGNGYYLNENAGGNLTFYVDGGGVVSSGVTTANLGECAWCYALPIVNRTPQEMQLKTNCGAGPRNSIAALGTLSSTTIFRWGAGQSNSCACQIAYAALWSGAAAEDVDANWDAVYEALLWTHGRGLGASPGIVVPLSYKAYTDPIGTMIGSDAEGEVYCDWAARAAAGSNPLVQFPWAYNAAFSHASKLGLAIPNAKTNLCQYSDHFNGAGWAATNISLSIVWASLTSAPNGMRTAQQLTATAAAGYYDYAFACSASTLYTMDIFVKRDASMGADVAGALIAYDNIGAGVIATQAFTAGTTWQRVILAVTTPVGCTNASIRIRIDNNTEIIAVARVSVREGLLSGPLFRRGAFGSSPAGQGDFRISGVAGQYMHGDKGEIEIVYVCYGDDNPSGRRYIVSSAPSADRRIGRVESTEDDSSLYYDSGGVFQQQDITAVVNQAVEHTLRIRWDMTATLPSGRYTETILDGVTTPGAAAPFAWGNNNTDIFAGENYTSLDQLDGVIAHIKIYDSPQP